MLVLWITLVAGCALDVRCVTQPQMLRDLAQEARLCAGSLKLEGRSNKADVCGPQFASCFLHNKCPCSYIPWLKAIFIKCFKTATGNVTKIY